MIADMMTITPDYIVCWDTGIALTTCGQDKPLAKAYVDFLQSAAGAAIFARWD